MTGDRESLLDQALLDAAKAWLRERGMTRIRGPYNLNTNHEFGLLVDPFDDWGDLDCLRVRDIAELAEHVREARCV